MAKVSHSYAGTGVDPRVHYVMENHLSDLLVSMAAWLNREDFDSEVDAVIVRPEFDHSDDTFYWSAAVYYDQNAVRGRRCSA